MAKFAFAKRKTLGPLKRQNGIIKHSAGGAKSSKEDNSSFFMQKSGI